jgi:CDP-glucose 4,6-dehydratase
MEGMGLSNSSFQEYDGKKVLVTGDTGFKGSWLALWLSQLGASVTGIGLDPKTPHDNYVICGLDSVINHYSCDIRNYDKIHDIFTSTRPDIVFHLAAQPLVSESYKSPRETFEVNTQGTANILESIRHSSSVHAAVMITSDKCYENQEWVYGYRETDPMGGRDPYSASKGAAEIIISSYTRSFFSHEGSAAVSSVRAGNVIGGGDWSENRIIPDFMRSIKSGKPLILRNPGAVRPWQHVLEPLYGYLILGIRLLSDGHKYSGAWNFGPLNNNIITVEELVRRFIIRCKQGEIEKPDHPVGFPESGYLSLDISKALRELRWQPVMDIDTMIQYTLDEYSIGGMTPAEIFAQRCRHIDEYTSMQNGVP